MSDEALSRYARRTMQSGSRSFSAAALLFGRRMRDDSRLLYCWCRYCDDAVDLAPDAPTARANLEELQRETRRACASYGSDLSAPFMALSSLVSRHGIPHRYPEDLLTGMKMDLDGRTYESVDELRYYCYCVAGTVGLMMSHVMGLSDERSLPRAVDLGIAMQLTNIVRDVREDFENGRIYLPLAWLREAGIPPARLTDPKHRHALAGVCARLLDLADGHYRRGLDGVRHLPWRAALAVAFAAALYRRIGVLVRRRGARAWDSRTVVGPAGKLGVLAGFLPRALAISAARLLAPRRVRPVRTEWRYI